MSRNEVVVEGTLKSDGTLQLDSKPNLSPGRVTVILRPAAEPAPTQEGWWPYMQRVRAERVITVIKVDWKRGGVSFDEKIGKYRAGFRADQEERER